MRMCNYLIEIWIFIKLCLIICKIRHITHFYYTTDEMWLETVKINRNAVRFINNQTKKICLDTVKQNPFVIVYIKNQTDKICMEAVKKNENAYRFVNDQCTSFTKYLSINHYIIYYLSECDIKIYICIFRYLLHNIKKINNKLKHRYIYHDYTKLDII